MAVSGSGSGMFGDFQIMWPPYSSNGAGNSCRAHRGRRAHLSNVAFAAWRSSWHWNAQRLGHKPMQNIRNRWSSSWRATILQSAGL